MRELSWLFKSVPLSCKQEIRRLIGKIQEKGFTLVPLRLYFLGGKAKVELALVKGKKLYG